MKMGVKQRRGTLLLIPAYTHNAYLDSSDSSHKIWFIGISVSLALLLTGLLP